MSSNVLELPVLHVPVATYEQLSYQSNMVDAYYKKFNELEGMVKSWCEIYTSFRRLERVLGIPEAGDDLKAYVEVMRRIGKLGRKILTLADGLHGVPFVHAAVKREDFEACIELLEEDLLAVEEDIAGNKPDPALMALFS